MSVASMSGVTRPAASARLVGSPSVSTAPVTTPSLPGVPATTSAPARATMLVSWGSWSRTTVKRSRKPASSTTATLAWQWPAR